MPTLETIRDALPAAFRNAALAGAAALLLAIPFVGVRLDTFEGRNTLTFHPVDIAIAVAAVVLIKLIRDAASSEGAVRVRAAALAPFSRLAGRSGSRRAVGRIAGLVAIVFALVFPFTPLASRYTLDLGATFLTYVMLGWGLDVVVGLAGLLDLGYVAFYAAGAYTFGILATDFGVGFWAALPLSGLVAGTLGITLGFPVLRLKGDYLAIVTLGFGEIIRIIIINWYQLTGGPNGITQIPRPTFFGVPFAPAAKPGATTFAHLFGIPFSPLQRVAWLYLVILAMTLATLAFTSRLRRLPIGRAWEALREDEIACSAVGVNPTIIKLTAFAIGATLGGFAGCFFAAHQGFISPESFTFTESALVLAIVVLGGGGRFGIAAAAAVLVGAPELGRDFAQYRMLVFGALMVLVMVWRPGGFTSGREPSIRATPKAPAGALLSGDGSRGVVGLSGLVTTRLALIARGLTMRFGGLTAVSDLDLIAETGMVTSLIGPNGAGKTTAFNCMTGFYKPSAGEVTIRDPDGHSRRIDNLPGHLMVSDAKVVRTFQTTRLFAGMTALENLLVAQHRTMSRSGLLQLQGLFGLPAYRRAEKAAVEKAMYWLDRLGLGARADDRAGELPYGLQRRLEIARAMCLDPHFLCLDEPAAGLNPRESATLESDLLLLTREDGIGVLLIEHDMSVVMGVSDRVFVLDRGRKIAEGVPDVIRGNREVIAAYLGEPAGAPPRAPRADAAPQTADGLDPAPTIPMLECRKVRSGYGAVAVLHDVDLRVAEGEIVALLGANGAGKSTLLRTLFGAPRSTGGEILLAGRPIGRLRAHEVARLGVAHVPEGRHVMPQMTVRENLKTGSRLGREDFEADLRKVLDLFPRLGERLSQRAGTMSGGEQQMLAIGRAMMQRPKLLLLDEPSLGLAPLVIRLIFDAICLLNEREGLTVLLVEQNVAQALAISDRGYVLQTGRVVAEGSAQELAARFEVSDAYL